MPDRDQSLDMLRELRDVGVSPPRPEVLHGRVSSAIAEEIDRESRPRDGGLNGSSPGTPKSERFGGTRPRLRRARLAGGVAPVVGALVVALVVAVFFGLRGSGPSSTAPSHGTGHSRGLVELVYQGLPSPQAPVVTRAALERTVKIIRVRLGALGIGGAHVAVSGGNQIMVRLPNARETAAAEVEVGTTAQLLVYDWEANVLTPNGKPVASQLQAQDPGAITISQGSGSLQPGSPGADSMGLYQAVQLASKQPYWASSANVRITTQYWEFGAPGSAACATAAKDLGTAPVAGVHCVLSGPDDNLSDLDSGLPGGVSASAGQVLAIPRGWIVVQAIPSSFAHPTPITEPHAQFFVLKDDVALRGSDITNPRQSTDPNTGTPEITFGFSSKGRTEFHNLTAAIARRGALVSGPGQSLNQHFAVALGGETDQLITVPYIDYQQYPAGINGDNRADISGSFTITSAQNLVNELRLGALPLNLKLICAGAPATTPCHSPSLR
jgi:SecD/SecF fusion protein